MADLAEAEAQLAQVEQAIRVEPENANLLSIAANLRELIALQSQLSGNSNHSKNKNSSEVFEVKGWHVGQDVRAVWSEDGKYYNAIITAFSADKTKATVTFPEYDDSGEVKLESLKKIGGAAAAGTQNEGAAVVGSNPVKKKKQTWEAKLKKEAKRQAVEEEKTKVLEAKTNDWKSFATKAKKKKGFRAAGAKGQSIFKTPDNPEGKVGVGTCGIGGKGMTKYNERGKWQFNEADEDN